MDALIALAAIWTPWWVLYRLKAYTYRRKMRLHKEAKERETKI